MSLWQARMSGDDFQRTGSFAEVKGKFAGGSRRLHSNLETRRQYRLCKMLPVIWASRWQV